MSHRDRSARGDLAAENRDHRPRRSEDVAKAYCEESRPGTGLSLHRADDAFSESLTGAHDVGRVDRLIGRDEDELSRSVFRCEAGDDLGAEDVILEGFGWLRLHHRYVLVRGSMQDELGLEADEDVAHAVDIGDIADDGRNERARAGGDELLFCLVEKYLALIEHDKAGGRTRRDLTTKLGADAPAGARDEHGASLDHHVDGLVIELGGFASQDILDGDGPDIARAYAAAGELGHGWDDEHAQVAGCGEGAHFPNAAHGRGG